MELRSSGDGADHEIVILDRGTTEDEINTKQKVLSKYILLWLNDIDQPLFAWLPES
jgi:hypothetical protein